MRCVQAIIVAWAMLLHCAVASASITVADPLDGTPTGAFAGVGLFGDSGGFYGSGTAFGGGQYVLTARHLVTSDGTIGGAPKAAASLRFKLDAATFTASEVFASFDADLAVVKLATPAPSSFDLWTGVAGDEAGETFTAVGFGNTDADGNGLWGPGGFGAKRFFENKVNLIQSGTISGQGQVLRYDFDKTGGDPVGTLEGIHGPGDSGGGAFFFDGADHLLAGVMSSSGDPIHGATGSLIEVAAYRHAILAVVPEPSGVLILFTLFSLLGATRRAGRRRVDWSG